MDSAVWTLLSVVRKARAVELHFQGGAPRRLNQTAAAKFLQSDAFCFEAARRLLPQNADTVFGHVGAIVILTGDDCYLACRNTRWRERSEKSSGLRWTCCFAHSVHSVVEICLIERASWMESVGCSSQGRPSTTNLGNAMVGRRRLTARVPSHRPELGG